MHLKLSNEHVINLFRNLLWNKVVSNQLEIEFCSLMLFENIFPINILSLYSYSVY